MRMHAFFMLVLVVSFVTTTVYADQTLIPSWIKNVAKLWSKNQIGDSEFVKTIQYLIEQNIISVPQTLATSISQPHIPAWIKNDAGWWSDGTIGDDDFVKAIQYLVQINIIKIDNGQSLSLTSNVFENNGTIPREYTCDGNNTSPPLLISNVPNDAKSLALIVDDPDAKPKTFVHWIIWDISPDTMGFSTGEKIPFPQGLNGRGSPQYTGPCPPTGIHHYYFKLYALDEDLQFNSTPTKQDLENGMANHILAQTTLLGLYSRS